VMPYFRDYRATWQQAIALFKAQRAQGQASEKGNTFAAVS
jgi:hypothetical protein